MVEHYQRQSKLNLFQILRQIPSTAQHTVDFHSLYFIVDAVKYKILVNDHPTVSRVEAVDLAHFRGIAQFCDLLPQLFQYAASCFRVKARQISGDIVQVLYSKGQIFDFIRHTVHGASPIHFRGLPTAVQDLNDIARYLSGFYPKTASRVLKEMRDKIAKLGDNPKMCEIYPLDPVYRQMVVEQYLVFYQVNDYARTVEIHRVLRGSWNLPQYLE